MTAPTHSIRSRDSVGIRRQAGFSPAARLPALLVAAAVAALLAAAATASAGAAPRLDLP